MARAATLVITSGIVPFLLFSVYEVILENKYKFIFGMGGKVQLDVFFYSIENC